MRLRSVLPAMALSLACWLRAPLAAQYVGSNVKGDFGLKSATQPGPGLYLSGFFYRYDVDKIRDRTGAEFGRGALDINAFAPLVWGVTKQKILGANYGIIFALPLQNAAIELPTFQADAGVGFGDMYLVPLNLGWHFSRADVSAGYGFYAPTGRYKFDARNNLGLGMWSHEISAGSTVYFDESKNWHAATTGYYEMHTKKRDSDIKVGDILTLEGGAGRSFIKRAGNAGFVYYSQWKVTDDTGGDFPTRLTRAKNRVYGVGPEVTMPFFAKGQWAGLFTFRYYWEAGARAATQGRGMILYLTFAHLSK